MRGFRLTRMLVKAAIRESNRSRRQQQRKKVQPKSRKTSLPKSRAVPKTAYPPYVQPGRYAPPPYQPPQPVQYSAPYQGQQPPYQPGQFQPPPVYPPYNQQHPLPHESFTRWFSQQGRNTKVGCICFLIIGVLVLCGVSATIGNAVNANNGTIATVPTTIVAIPSDTPTTIVQAILPTDTPTATPTTKPTPKPTPTPTQLVVRPTPTQSHTGVNGNPWGYDFNPGRYIDYPPSGFCSYFNCISTFYESDDPGDGYIIECQDGTYSQSGGERGACSSHGGELRPLYSH